jgi:hypothetical protein
MGRPSDRDAFRILFREFFAQLFVSESSISDHQHRVAMIGVLVFLITPGLLMPIQLIATFELAAIRFPVLVDPLTRLMATIFVTFAIVAVGVVAAFEWDSLAFDRRDGMVLGPLPVSGRTIVAAKLAALGALLLIAASGINILGAVPFSLIATSHQPFASTIRLFVAHLVTTMSASVFVFCTLAMIRAALGLFDRGRVAIGTIFQFAMISGLLCFIVFVPTSLKVEFLRVPHRPTRPIGVHMQPIPGWSPTNWFVGLYDVIRGAAQTGSHYQAIVALAMTLASVAAAVVTIVIGYRHQLRLALAPSSSSGVVAGARLPRAIARLLAGQRPPARAVADFIVATLARSRAQQAPVAINAAIGVGMIVMDMSRRGSDFAGLAQASTVVARIPLLLAFWLAVGMRASFFIPTELPAAWTFRANAVEGSRSSHAAIRGAMVSLLVCAATLLAFMLSVASGWHEALWHTSFVALVVLLLIEVVAMTVPFIPFTRAYEPGHLKLKTRWPLYVIGVYVVAYLLLRIEQACRSDSTSFVVLLLCLATLAGALDLAGQKRARRRSLAPSEEFADDEGRIAVLDISAVVPRACAEK